MSEPKQIQAVVVEKWQTAYDHGSGNVALMFAVKNGQVINLVLSAKAAAEMGQSMVKLGTNPPSPSKGPN